MDGQLLLWILGFGVLGSVGSVAGAGLMLLFPVQIVTSSSLASSAMPPSRSSARCCWG
jgi:hypothetical protein